MQYFIRYECRILESLDPNSKFYGLVHGFTGIQASS